MADFRGEKKYAHYNFFMVGNAVSNYTLQVAGYSGTAGDSIMFGSGKQNLNGMSFSTRDQPHGSTCASSYGPWWHNGCMFSKLNGGYYHDVCPPFWNGINWGTFTSHSRSLKFAEMKLRARD